MVGMRGCGTPGCHSRVDHSRADFIFAVGFFFSLLNMKDPFKGHWPAPLSQSHKTPPDPYSSFCALKQLLSDSDQVTNSSAHRCGASKQAGRRRREGKIHSWDESGQTFPTDASWGQTSAPVPVLSLPAAPHRAQERLLGCWSSVDRGGKTGASSCFPQCRKDGASGTRRAINNCFVKSMAGLRCGQRDSEGQVGTVMGRDLPLAEL